MKSSTSQETCRVLIIGSHRTRVAKVVSILKYGPVVDGTATIDVEYVPCVAKFDSYDDGQGNTVRYLASVDYYDGDVPSSLLPFFDVDCRDEDALFQGIAGAAIGSGVEGEEDTSRIEAFFQSMVSGGSDAIPAIRCIKPNPGYSSMEEELSAYKALSNEEKEQVTRLQTMGPGKMAKFAADFAQELIADAIEKRRPKAAAAAVDDQADAQRSDTEKVEPRPSHFIDPDKNRFSCRKCRCILFGEDDLQDPPHVPSKHQFSHRKQHYGSGIGSNSCELCQSYFLQEQLDWMDPDATEGKFSCPSCDCKLGSWHWSGAQCSCGTWVVPAIQVPKSKVDLIQPRPATMLLPPGTVISPLLHQVTDASIPKSNDTSAPNNSSG